MAHFLTLVLLDPDEPAYADAAEAKMRRYFAPDLGGPEAKCDGFTIGGRIDGELWDKEQNYNLSPAEFQARYGFDKIKAEDNIRPVADLRPDLVPYAVITPDGGWLDRAGMTDQQWETEWNHLRDRFRSPIAVAMDCHC